MCMCTSCACLPGCSTARVPALGRGSTKGELGVNLDSADDDGATPACIAAQEGQLGALRVLAAHGADLNLATKVSDGTDAGYGP